jgi:hypothetical protein
MAEHIDVMDLRRTKEKQMTITDYCAYVEDLRELEDAEEFVAGVDPSGLRILVDKEFIVAAYKLIKKEKANDTSNIT